jgi:hypothetical protein
MIAIWQKLHVSGLQANSRHIQQDYEDLHRGSWCSGRKSRKIIRADFVSFRTGALVDLDGNELSKNPN